MNQITLIGNFTRDPELAKTPNGVSVCRFSIAVARDYKNEDGTRETDFFNVTAWRALAETIAKYQKKGMKIFVQGKAQPRTYEDNNGVKHTTLDIIAENVEFLSPKRDDGAVNENVRTPDINDFAGGGDEPAF